MDCQTQDDAPTAGEQAILDWANHLPGPERPVLDLALYGAGKRYGGFTSWLHAHKVARALGLREYKICRPAPSSGPTCHDTTHVGHCS